MRGLSCHCWPRLEEDGRQCVSRTCLLSLLQCPFWQAKESLSPSLVNCSLLVKSTYCRSLGICPGCSCTSKLDQSLSQGSAGVHASQVQCLSFALGCSAPTGIVSLHFAHSHPLPSLIITINMATNGIATFTAH